MQSRRDRLAGCSFWTLRFAVYFKWRQFEPEVILLAVGWYLRFSLSYRDVEELLAERGLLVDHVAVWRWVQRYAPELERRLRTLSPKFALTPKLQHYRLFGWPYWIGVLFMGVSRTVATLIVRDVWDPGRTIPIWGKTGIISFAVYAMSLSYIPVIIASRLRGDPSW